MILYTSTSDIKQAVIRLLARREHSKKELYTKLQGRCENKGLLTTVIDECEMADYQSDDRFIEMIIRTRSDQGYGLNKINQELRQKGISDQQKNSILATMNIDWFEVAAICFDRKYGHKYSSERKVKDKCFRSMSARGFMIDQIYYAVAQYEENRD